MLKVNFDYLSLSNTRMNFEIQTSRKREKSNKCAKCWVLVIWWKNKKTYEETKEWRNYRIMLKNNSKEMYFIITTACL